MGILTFSDGWKQTSNLLTMKKTECRQSKLDILGTLKLLDLLVPKCQATTGKHQTQPLIDILHGNLSMYVTPNVILGISTIIN